MNSHGQPWDVEPTIPATVEFLTIIEVENFDFFQFVLDMNLYSGRPLEVFGSDFGPYEPLCDHQNAQNVTKRYFLESEIFVMRRPIISKKQTFHLYFFPKFFFTCERFW